jgi:hypothetical protein
MPTEIIVMATMAAALFLVAGVWAEPLQEQQVRYSVRKRQVRTPEP